MAKAVMVMADKNLVMAVLPVSHRLDLDALRNSLGAQKLRLAQEEEFEEVFPGCELGAMPPLGNLYDVAVWVDETLRANPSLVFDAGSHTDTVEMSYSDFERLVKPRRGRFAVLRH